MLNVSNEDREKLSSNVESFAIEDVYNKAKKYSKSIFLINTIKSLLYFSFVFVRHLKNNTVIINKTKKSLIKIRFKKSKGNIINISDGFSGKLTINCSGNNNLIHIGYNVNLSKSSINITQSNTVIVIGNHVSIGKNNKISINEYSGNASFIIGDDCMISSNVELRTYDSHPIYDLNDNIKNIGNNDVTICKHVWIGQDSKILKGVTIGNGCIVGAGSVVTKNIDNNCIAAGIPARIIRRNDFYWARDNSEQSRIHGKKLSFEDK